MVYISDLIKNRLNKISDLNERKMMKRILEVYEDLTNYNMNMYKELEENIYNEIKDPSDKFYIYSTLIDVQHINHTNHFFHPIIKEDLNTLIIETDKLNKDIHSGIEIILNTVFLRCSYLVFQEILDNKKIYDGFIKTNKNQYKIKVKLKQNKKYIKEIENLYQIFQLNLINWNTINCPYIYKFVDVILDSEIDIKQGEKIEDIVVNLEEYEKYKIINVVPVWNIKKIKVQDKMFPQPAKDKINKEHSISLYDTGVEDGYMLTSENEHFEYFERKDNELIIVSFLSKQNSWNLIQFKDMSELNNNITNYSLNYEVLSNKKNLGFIGRFASQKSIIIRTRGEIARLISSYDLRKDLSFYNAELINKYNKQIQTIDFNAFINDDIRDDNSKKILVLQFKADNKDDFLIFDKMSFLVSEIQLLLPEYKCIGELI